MRLPSSLPEHDTATVDEMVFQTLMITYLYASPCLHYPIKPNPLTEKP